MLQRNWLIAKILIAILKKNYRCNCFLVLNYFLPILGNCKAILHLSGINVTNFLSCLRLLVPLITVTMTTLMHTWLWQMQCCISYEFCSWWLNVLQPTSSLQCFSIILRAFLPSSVCLRSTGCWTCFHNWVHLLCWAVVIATHFWPISTFISLNGARTKCHG